MNLWTFFNSENWLVDKNQLFTCLGFHLDQTGPFYCHTRLHLGFSANLRIRQVPACKMEPRSGNIFCKNRPDRPTSQSSLRSCFCFQCCAVSPLPPTLAPCSIPTSGRGTPWLYYSGQDILASGAQPGYPHPTIRNGLYKRT